MAHFANVDENNKVVTVVVVPDSEEHRGAEFLQEIGLEGNWIQTSITNRIRKVFAQPGFDYLPELDAFKPSKPVGLESYVFDEELWAWVPPVVSPGEGHVWDESTTSWILAAPIQQKSDAPLPTWWTYDDNGNPKPPWLPLKHDTIHYWDNELKDWVDTGEPQPGPPSLPAV